MDETLAWATLESAVQGFGITSGTLGCTQEKIFIQSTNDEHGPRVDLEMAYADVLPPKRLVWVEAEDHFFKGALDDFERVIQSLD